MHDTNEKIYDTNTNEKMIPHLKEKWVKALRSGEYQQGYSLLKKQYEEEPTPCFCALGVLCDVYDPNGWSEGYHNGKCINYYYRYRSENECLILTSDISIPDKTGTMTGLSSPSIRLPFCSKTGQTLYISDLNDSREFTFDQIADIVEYFL